MFCGRILILYISELLFYNFWQVCPNCVLCVHGNISSETIFWNVFWFSLKNRSMAKIIIRVCQKSILLARKVFSRKLFLIENPIFSQFSSSLSAKDFRLLTWKFQQGSQNCILPMQKHVLREIIVREKSIIVNSFGFLTNLLGPVCRNYIRCAQVYGRYCHYCIKRVKRHVLRRSLLRENF